MIVTIVITVVSVILIQTALSNIKKYKLYKEYDTFKKSMIKEEKHKKTCIKEFMSEDEYMEFKKKHPEYHCTEIITSTFLTLYDKKFNKRIKEVSLQLDSGEYLKDKIIVVLEQNNINTLDKCTN